MKLPRLAHLRWRSKGKRVIRVPRALTRQAQEGIALVDCFPDTARFPIAIEVHHGRSLHREEREQVEPAYPSGVHPVEPLAASYPFPTPPTDQGNRDAELDNGSGIR
jgi:hypothetical protein